MPPVARVAVFALLAMVVLFVGLRAVGRARYGDGWSRRASNRYGYGVLFLGLMLVGTFVVPGARVVIPVIGLILAAWLLAPPVLRKLGWQPLPPPDDRL